MFKNILIDTVVDSNNYTGFTTACKMQPLWPVKARPGDNWLAMVGTDGHGLAVKVNVAVGIGLGNRYKLGNSNRIGLSKKDISRAI